MSEQRVRSLLAKKYVEGRSIMRSLQDKLEDMETESLYSWLEYFDRLLDSIEEISQLLEIEQEEETDYQVLLGFYLEIDSIHAEKA